MEATTAQECPYCNVVLPLRGYFCPSCREQVRCKTCSELVEKNAVGCVMCGAEIASTTIKQDSDVIDGGQISRNKISFEKKGNSIKLDADITDISSAYFADTIGFIVTGGTNSLRNRQNKPLFLQKGIQGGAISIPVNNNEKVDFAKTVTVESEEDFQEVLKKIFTFENESLKLIDPRLKHSGKLDQAVRLTLLVIYTYELMGNPQIERTALTNILRQSKLDDGHSREWISNSNELILKDNNVELSVPGREVAKAILAEIADPTIEVGKVVYSKSKSQKSNKKGKEGKKGQSSSSTESKTSSSKPSPLSMLQSLVQEGFFKEKKKIKDIVEHCSTNKAQYYKSSDLSGPLGRAIKDKLLKREKNKSDNQYEYYA
ncbi:zinc ribbon domain-containing protein [Fibrella sp. WM1]|uniref:zinc ribbon domain-containing protein n=1 Tax=Fibrella musci TaxID=3242485 RepID=UPI003522F987